jgi:hypothetical protein
VASAELFTVLLQLNISYFHASEGVTKQNEAVNALCECSPAIVPEKRSTVYSGPEISQNGTIILYD